MSATWLEDLFLGGHSHHADDGDRGPRSCCMEERLQAHRRPARHRLSRYHSPHCRSGLSDPRRPIGSFIFLGKTGVGKAGPAAKAPGRVPVRWRIRRHEREYREQHTVSRLFGKCRPVTAGIRAGRPAYRADPAAGPTPWCYSTRSKKLHLDV